MLLLATPLLAQESAKEQNPLVELRDQVKKVLADASVPFTEDQEKSIALMMEDRRQASEELFGQLMDFRNGPVSGQQQDRAVAAIQWMQAEFKKRLNGFLTPAQSSVWEKFEGTLATAATANGAAPPPPQQTQLIRINNNMFTAEGPCYGCGGERTEVIQRGGIGTFHGNANFDFKDESLNARNPFASNKPAYQQRNTSANVNGPFIRNLLTANIGFNHSLQENPDTIHATTPTGPFDLGISHPFTNRNVNTGGTLQLSEKHSITFNGGFGGYNSKNQGIGGFTLPERSSTGKGNFTNIQINQFSVFSPRTIYETRFGLFRNHDETKPASEAVQINVLDAFRSGGAQNRSEQNRDNFNVSNLFSRMGERLTTKAGFDSTFIKNRSLSEQNFIGTFTFSSMADYLKGTPDSFNVNRGLPALEFDQFQWSAFVQSDLKITQRLTAMFGLRFEDQTNISDHNNFAPRLGFAYAMNRTTVIRGGAGVFYGRLWDFLLQNQRRQDGTRQYEIVIQNPSYPDPFKSGTVTVVPPKSLRVTDPALSVPYEAYMSVGVEKTFMKNLFVGLKYDHSRGVHQYRSRNLNAPLPGQANAPDPSKGNVWNLESTAFSRFQILGASVRERFSIFTISAGYNYFAMFGDSEGPFGTPSNSYNLRQDWGRLNTPVHQFNSSVNAKLFWGIFLTESMNANSGNRYNITTGTDDNSDGVFNDRPAGIARNAGDGPRFVNFNFNVSKAVYLGGKPEPAGGNSGSRANVNVFANMTNAFNRTNYGTPSGVKSSANFGKPFNARNAREIQVGLRFQF